MVGQMARKSGQLVMVALVVLGVLLAGRPSPASAELYSVDEVVNAMIPLLDEYWAEAIYNMGYEYVSPAGIYYYNVDGSGESAQSACGALAPNNAFYCWYDWSIYLDYTFLNNAISTYGDFAVAAVVAHEWGHHIEQVLGMEYAVYYSIQLELYADCATGAVTSMMDWNGMLDPDDLEEGYLLALAIGDPIGTDAGAPGAHGTSDQRIEAFMGGYLLGDPAGCGMVVDTLVPVA